MAQILRFGIGSTFAGLCPGHRYFATGFLASVPDGWQIVPSSHHRRRNTGRYAPAGTVGGCFRSDRKRISGVIPDLAT
jgi:hypothetical protein